MATREQKMKFAIKRFKGFWNQFRRSKRGIFGISIIIIFSFIAIFAPYIAPYPPIDPKYGVGEYQALGLASGKPIATKLSKPIWYKYLPWIPRGEQIIQEKFYTYTGTYYGTTLQFVIPYEKYDPNTTPLLTLEEKNNISVADRLTLSRRVSMIETVEAKLPNGTVKELSDEEWYQEPQRPREIILGPIFPDDTEITVTYKTGVDLVENMKIVTDHKFSTSESLDSWTWSSNYADRIEVSYNAEKGIKLKETDDSGCIQISYKAAGTPPTEPVQVTLSYKFSYPYFQPPERFWVHVSSKSEGISRYYIEASFYNEDSGEKFLLKRAEIYTPSPEYVYKEVDSTEDVVASNVGLSPPQDRIFPTHGNYSFQVTLIFNPSTNVNFYLDHVDCLLYGNIFGLLGTDNTTPYTKDLFSSLIYGSRVSLIVGVLTAIFSTFIGLFLGLIAGYVGGVVDEVIMRFADLLLVLPTLPLFIVLVTALRASSGYISMWNIIFILTFFGWMSFARSVRSMVLSLKERAFIEAAKAAGGTTMHIINRHVIPNVFALVYITLATSVPGAIITEASLSWLGLGDTRLASWGKILYEFNNSGVVTSKGLLEYWFWVFPACIAIAILAAAFILVGYALDEILNPRLRERR